MIREKNKTMVQVFKNGVARAEDLPLFILLVFVSRVVFNAMAKRGDRDERTLALEDYKITKDH